MASLSYLFSLLLINTPTFVVLVAGLFLLTTHRRALHRSAGMAVVGCAVLLFCAAANLAWNVGLPYMGHAGRLTIDRLITAGVSVGLLLSIAQAVGLGLLIAGVLRGARTAPVQDQVPPAPFRG